VITGKSKDYVERKSKEDIQKRVGKNRANIQEECLQEDKQEWKRFYHKMTQTD
jgi:hypothetical protein